MDDRHFGYITKLTKKQHCSLSLSLSLSLCLSVSWEINGGMDLGTMCEGIEFGSGAKNLHGLCVQRHTESVMPILKKAHGGWECHLFMFWSDGAIALSGACMQILLPFLQGIFVRRAPPSIGSGRELPGLESHSDIQHKTACAHNCKVLR
jgi:hypothetical protein